jgi:hypothetical protein
LKTKKEEEEEEEKRGRGSRRRIAARVGYFTVCKREISF